MENRPPTRRELERIEERHYNRKRLLERRGWLVEDEMPIRQEDIETLITEVTRVRRIMRSVWIFVHDPVRAEEEWVAVLKKKLRGLDNDPDRPEGR